MNAIMRTTLNSLITAGLRCASAWAAAIHGSRPKGH